MQDKSGTVQMAYEAVKQSNAVPPYILALAMTLFAWLGPADQLKDIGSKVSIVDLKLARIEASIQTAEERSRDAIQRVALLEQTVKDMQVSAAQESGEITGWRQQTAGDLAAIRVRVGKIEDKQEE